MILPALRGIDAYPVEMDGEIFIGVRDPEGIVEDQLVMSQSAFVIASFLNGERDASTIQYELASQFQGQLIPVDQILSVAETLDKHGFLNSDKFHKIRLKVRKNYAGLSVRSAYLAGKSYPGDQAELKVFLEAQFLREGSCGKIPVVKSARKHLRCLIAPHIDLHRGGHSYGWAYSHLSKFQCPETVLIFGVAHAAPPSPFIMTRKNFETPFGIIHADLEGIDRLAKVCKWDPYEYELTHRTEHSIEFQVLMLAYLFGTRCRILPVLCGMFGDELHGDPESNDEIQAFLTECRTLLKERGDTMLVICGADFAHVGQRFGDAFEIETNVISDVETRDREDLKHALAGDADAFFKSVMKDANRRRVCSLNNIYSALKVLPDPKSGELLHYGYAHDPMGGIVSFASLAF
jgi:MEMO1 family protein